MTRLQSCPSARVLARLSPQLGARIAYTLSLLPGLPPSSLRDSPPPSVDLHLWLASTLSSPPPPPLPHPRVPSRLASTLGSPRGLPPPSGPLAARLHPRVPSRLASTLGLPPPSPLGLPPLSVCLHPRLASILNSPPPPPLGLPPPSPRLHPRFNPRVPSALASVGSTPSLAPLPSS